MNAGSAPDEQRPVRYAVFNLRLKESEWSRSSTGLREPVDRFRAEGVDRWLGV